MKETVIVFGGRGGIKFRVWNVSFIKRDITSDNKILSDEIKALITTMIG